MYETFFQLSRRPFTAAPQGDLYYQAETIEQSRQSLVRAVDREEGPSLIVGPAGTGKTLLCQLVASHFENDFRVVTLASGRLCTRRALLQNILFGLKLPYREMDEGELRLSLADQMEPRGEGDRGILLVVDEAHTLPYRLFEEIRTLSNHVHEGRPRVSLVLAGNANLEEQFAHPKMASFNQRIALRCYLHALSRAETHQFVLHQLAQVERSGEIFVERALDAIFTATDGIPRLINQLCDHALLLACLGDRPQISERGVEEAWADLQQLPAPWSADTADADSGEASSVVEFGALSDGDDEAPAEIDSATIGLSSDFPREPAEGPEFPVPENELDPTNTIPFPVHIAKHFAETSSPLTEPAAEPTSALTAAPSEVELFFHEAHDPFGESFEEEEVVIDHYASLDTPGTFVEKVVRCAESDEIRRHLEGNPASAESRNAESVEAPADAAAGRESFVIEVAGELETASEPEPANHLHPEGQAVAETPERQPAHPASPPEPEESITGTLLMRDIPIHTEIPPEPAQSDEEPADKSEAASADSSPDTHRELGEAAPVVNILFGEEQRTHESSSNSPAPASPVPVLPAATSPNVQSPNVQSPAAVDLPLDPVAANSVPETTAGIDFSTQSPQPNVESLPEPGFRPAADPVLPVAGNSEPAFAESPARSTAAGRATEGPKTGEASPGVDDDRDLLLVSSTKAEVPAAAVRKTNYRRLFAQLREK